MTYEQAKKLRDEAQRAFNKNSKLASKAKQPKWRTVYKQRAAAALKTAHKYGDLMKKLNAVRVSGAGVDLIAGFEGFVDHAYKPVAAERFWTIGYGHYGADVKAGAKITRERALVLLNQDVQKFATGVKKLLKRKANQHEFDAMVSLAYNIGLGNFMSSSVLRHFNAGRKQSAADSFGMWVNGASGRLQGLVDRRARERKLFLTAVK